MHSNPTQTFSGIWILIFCLLRIPCKILGPYDNPFLVLQTFFWRQTDRPRFRCFLLKHTNVSDYLFTTWIHITILSELSYHEIVWKRVNLFSIFVNIWSIRLGFSLHSDILFVLSAFYLFLLNAYNFPIQIVLLFLFECKKGFLYYTDKTYKSLNNYVQRHEFYTWVRSH